VKSLESWERPARRAALWAHRHHRGIAAAVLAVLFGTAITAFGVAPLAPDAADLPKRLIAEQVEPPDWQTQIEALGEFELQLTRNDLTRSTDTIDTLLARLNVSDAEAARFLRNDPVARQILLGRAGKMVQVQTGPAGELHRLIARYPAEKAEQFSTHFTRLTVERDAVGLKAKVEQAELNSQVALRSGTIETSLWAATAASQIPDTVTIQMAEIFSNEIDFRRDLRRGDFFAVVFESLEADGEPITWNQAAGRVLAAQFTNAGRLREAYWFHDPVLRKSAYFDGQGESLRRAFLSSPMEFSRVSSGFKMRFHPILKTWRRHLGVDYAAPTGTPVRTVADGVVDFAGWQNGYGNVVFIRHAGGRVTVYAHLSRMNVRQGQRVEQGQHIGAVGATGWATGPHLHFEIRENGQHVDPLRVARSSEAFSISPSSRVQFQAQSLAFKNQLALASQRQFAQAE
jgi:murein DD-endopeptidase MepM/ murein hydrolase activator NlpD